jgi:hypothetical protein
VDHRAGQRPAAAVTVGSAKAPPAPGVPVEVEGVRWSARHRLTVEVALDTLEVALDTPSEITDPGNRYGQAGGMPRQRKGWAILTRLPAREEAIVRRRAAEQGLSYSDVIANAVAVGLGHPAIYEPRYSPDDQLLAG